MKNLLGEDITVLDGQMSIEECIRKGNENEDIYKRTDNECEGLPQQFCRGRVEAPEAASRSRHF